MNIQSTINSITLFYLIAGSVILGGISNYLRKNNKPKYWRFLIVQVIGWLLTVYYYFRYLSLPIFNSQYLPAVKFVSFLYLTVGMVFMAGVTNYLQKNNKPKYWRFLIVQIVTWLLIIYYYFTVT